MDPATLVAICMMHSQNPAAYPLPSPGFACPILQPQAASADAGNLTRLRPVVSTLEARDALARMVVAEAGNQGDSGQAGVVYAILNRLADGRWGGTVEAVVDAPGQFEPVTRAGGSWRALPAVSAAQEARVNTIVNLALDGRLPDLTGGARYFQNPEIVAERARAGTVPTRLVNFGGAAPSAVIGAHAFYVAPGPRVALAKRGARANGRETGRGPGSAIFVGENRAAELQQASAPARNAVDSARPMRTSYGDGTDIFIAN